jgi:enoyl-CoA hydratase/carnithine racemase
VTSPRLTLEVKEQIAVLCLCRPEARNTFGEQFLTEFEVVLSTLRSLTNVRCLIVTSEGDVFSAGADLKDVTARSPADNWAWNHRLAHLITALAELPIPTVAAINGYALGGGLELALACTLRLAADSAVLGLPEVKLGIMPGAGGTHRLPRLIGAGRALSLLLTGRTITAAEALRVGLVEEVVARDQLCTRAMELAHAIARNAPVAVQAILRDVRAGEFLPLEPAIAMSEASTLTLLLTDDAREGITSFLEKRLPVFHGR